MHIYDTSTTSTCTSTCIIHQLHCTCTCTCITHQPRRNNGIVENRRRNSGIVENSGIMEMAEIVFCGLHKYYRTCNIAISANKLNSTVFPCPYLYMHMYNQQPVNVRI